MAHLAPRNKIQTNLVYLQMTPFHPAWMSFRKNTCNTRPSRGQGRAPILAQSQPRDNKSLNDNYCLLEWTLFKELSVSNVSSKDCSTVNFVARKNISFLVGAYPKQTSNSPLCETRNKRYKVCFSQPLSLF